MPKGRLTIGIVKNRVVMEIPDKRKTRVEFSAAEALAAAQLLLQRAFELDPALKKGLLQ